MNSVQGAPRSGFLGRPTVLGLECKSLLEPVNIPLSSITAMMHKTGVLHCSCLGGASRILSSYLYPKNMV